MPLMEELPPQPTATIFAMRRPALSLLNESCVEPNGVPVESISLSSGTDTSAQEPAGAVLPYW